MEFLSRFVQHILPRGFVRIRQSGFLANTCRTRRLALARTLLGCPRTSDPTPVATIHTLTSATWACPRCGAAMIFGPILSAPQLRTITFGWDTS
jgi:putative transposase